MYTSVMVVGALALLAVAYVAYGRRLVGRLGVDDCRQTPAHTQADGVDYVPARPAVLLGHHFASIAGVGPIIGPIAAAAFGWLPVLAWIVVGSIFAGGVHDMASLVASIRHGGQSVGHVIDRHVGRPARILFLLFSWSTLVLVIGVFTILVARTFVDAPQAGTSSALFIALAVAFGAAVYRRGANLAVATLVGVVLLGVCVYAGLLFPLRFGFTHWTVILLVYVAVASVAPVWVLLQPRDYLSSFLLYGTTLAGLAGVLASGSRISYPALASFTDPQLGPLFPVLFVTVACGAISGFHSLVASGTTAKQLNRECDARLIGYGGMLIEAVVAVIALSTVVVLSRESYAASSKNPVALFAAGVSSWLVRFGVPQEGGVTFVSLALSAFALTSLDTATRLARFAFQELLGRGPRSPLPVHLAASRVGATLVSVVAGGALAFSGAWKAIWPVFGSANQLLAALALLAVTVWLARAGRPRAFVAIPFVFMLTVTLASLLSLAHRHLLGGGSVVLGSIAFVLVVLAGSLVVVAINAMRGGPRQG